MHLRVDADIRFRVKHVASDMGLFVRKLIMLQVKKMIKVPAFVFG